MVSILIEYINYENIDDYYRKYFNLINIIILNKTKYLIEGT